MHNPFSLENKTILITGASSGIGRAAAVECSKMGARVIVTARNEERLKETLNLLEGEGHTMVICDLSDNDAIINMVDNLPEIQGLVSNAGYTKLLPLQFVNEVELSSIFQVNTFAPIMLLQRLLKKKKLKAGASVVYTSSIAGLGFCVNGNNMYSASKGAICAFVKNAALELAKKRIRVNSVCPSMVQTAIVNDGSVTEEQLKENLAKYPLGRAGEPEDIAYAMIYLLSDASSFVTGLNLLIDGGATIE